VSIASWFAAIAFYTRLPVPTAWALKFERVACFAPAVGVLIGAGLMLLDLGLAELGTPSFSRSAIVVVTWIAVTGGLHLDGAIDAADGLAVPDPKRRLAVMSESTTGAFGAISAVILILLKTAALTDLAPNLQIERGLGLVAAAGWGRWGQQIAIVYYPYLKPTGKGAFHKAALTSGWDIVPSLLLLLGLSALPLGLSIQHWPLALTLTSGAAIAIATAAWFARQFNGHTGDTYGAVVEWTEALILFSLVITQNLSPG
jgi:adenosylcobinamide-GDP ribazoletransferase